MKLIAPVKKGQQSNLRAAAAVKHPKNSDAHQLPKITDPKHNIFANALLANNNSAQMDVSHTLTALALK